MLISDDRWEGVYMGEESQSKRNFFQTAGVVITVLASLASVVSVWYQIRRAAPEITVALTDIQNLTKPPKVSELTARYEFGGKQVTDLWQVKVTLINTGKRTIIGEGPQKNIIRDSVNISLKPGFTILNLETDEMSFPNDLRAVDGTGFCMKFLQWRPKEDVKITLYLERIKTDVTAPELTAPERYLLDGDILFLDSLPKPEKRPLISTFPAVLITPARVFSFVCLGLVLLLLIFIVISVTYDWVKYYWWYRSNYSDFSNFVNKEFPVIAKTILDNPTKATKEVREKYTGVNPPTANILIEGDKKVWGFFIFYVVMFVLCAAIFFSLTALYYV